MYQKILEREIHLFHQYTYKEISGILMHYRTHMDFLKEITFEYYNVIHCENGLTKSKGITIYRSQDYPQGVITVF